MGFPEKVKAAAFAASGRCCCICHKQCGTKIELHHIKQHADGGDDTFENAIPLCFDCHADMGRIDPHHPRGNHYSEEELRIHRDNWYNTVSAHVDKIATVVYCPLGTISTQWANSWYGINFRASTAENQLQL